MATRNVIKFPPFIGSNPTTKLKDIRFYPVNVEIGDTFTITMPDTTLITFVATVATTANVISGLITQWATKVGSEDFTEFDTSDNGDYLYARASLSTNDVVLSNITTGTTNGGSNNTQLLTIEIGYHNVYIFVKKLNETDNSIIDSTITVELNENSELDMTSIVTGIYDLLFVDSTYSLLNIASYDHINTEVISSDDQVIDIFRFEYLIQSWAASTTYNAGEEVKSGGVRYTAKVDFTSDATSFQVSSWDLVVSSVDVFTHNLDSTNYTVDMVSTDGVSKGNVISDVIITIDTDTVTIKNAADVGYTDYKINLLNRANKVS